MTGPEPRPTCATAAYDQVDDVAMVTGDKRRYLAAYHLRGLGIVDLHPGV
jgi:hypothetical protein